MTITTVISECAAQAATFTGDDPPTAILLDLQDLAPVLEREVLHPERITGKPEREGTCRCEFAVATWHRADELEARAKEDGSTWDNCTVEGRLASEYSSMLLNEPLEVPLTMVLDLIEVCERNAELYETCEELAAMEQQRRQVAMRGSGCGHSWVSWQFDHVREHRKRMAGWLALAAYLAARLDAVGGVLAGDRRKDDDDDDALED